VTRRALLPLRQHLGGRDQKAVRKTVSGLIKLLHPDGEVTKEEVEEYLAYAMEMRRRVKEQLKKMGGLEYWDTSFSYIDRESGQETFVPVPEMGGGSPHRRGRSASGQRLHHRHRRQPTTASRCSCSKPR
jgi:predicted ATP-dependent Lon-type protease